MVSTVVKTIINDVKENQNGRKRDDFNQANKEIDVLLEIIEIFKVKMEEEEIDWEGIRSEYEKIIQVFHKNYPRKCGDLEMHDVFFMIYSK